MSRENLNRAHRILETLGERDAEKLIELADADVEWHSFFAIHEGGVYRGHQGTRQYMSDLSDAWEVGRPEVEDALSIGDVTVLVGRIHYRGKRGGVESTVPAGWMLKFKRGKLTCFRAFRDPDKALEAVGLRE